MQIALILYIIWTLQTKVIKSVSYNEYKNLSEILCEGQCKQLQCPSSTVIIIQMIKVIYGYLRGENCYESERSSAIMKDEISEHVCKKLLYKEFNEIKVPKCSTKSNCFVCHRRENTLRSKTCLQTTASSVNYICLPGEYSEEVVLQNSYVDLSCAHLYAHRIIIHKAVLVPSKELFHIKEKSKGCKSIDASESVGRECSFKYKCQTGPNSLSLNDCNSYKLLLNYSCVPESVLNLKTGIEEKDRALIVPPVPKREKILNEQNNVKANDRLQSNLSKFENNIIWIAIITSVTFLLIIALIALTCWCRSTPSSNSLSAKAKMANFGPPPSSIRNIEIDLNCDNNMLLKTKDECEDKIKGDSKNEFEDQNNTFWKNTTSRYNCQGLRHDELSCSLSAGSSGKMSSYQSESSKGNISTVYNYALREKSPIYQTPL